MYVPIPYKAPHPITTKVQAIKHIKARSKRFAKYANNPDIVKYIMNYHKAYAVKQLHKGIYTEMYPDYSDILNIATAISIPLEEYFEFSSSGSYGVCDGLQNFLDIFNEELATIPEKVFVTLTPIHRKQQPEYGGWRWRKWGPYIGNFKRTEEYLFNETEIDTVWIYHIYVIPPTGEI